MFRTIAVAIRSLLVVILAVSAGYSLALAADPILIQDPNAQKDAVFHGPLKAKTWIVVGTYDQTYAACRGITGDEISEFSLNYFMRLNKQPHDEWTFSIQSKNWTIFGRDGGHHVGHMVFHTPAGPERVAMIFTRASDKVIIAENINNAWLHLWKISSKVEFVIKGHFDDATGYLDLKNSSLALEEVMKCVYSNRNQIQSGK